MTHAMCSASLCLLTSLALAACGETSQERIELPIYARGTADAEFDAGDYRVQLDEARVGLGPIYVCASARSSSDLCPSAVGELTGGAEVDALDPEPARIGTLRALSQDARSIGLDYAITWPSSAAQPVALPEAPHGKSAVFAGRAVRGERSFEFSAVLDLRPHLRGTRAVQGLPTRASLERGMRLEIQLDAVSWWSQVDFAELDAAATEHVELDPDSAAYRTLVAAMTSNATPVFRWSR